VFHPPDNLYHAIKPHQAKQPSTAIIQKIAKASSSLTMIPLGSAGRGVLHPGNRVFHGAKNRKAIR
jgi:hypothetical protein